MIGFSWQQIWVNWRLKNWDLKTNELYYQFFHHYYRSDQVEMIFSSRSFPKKERIDSTLLLYFILTCDTKKTFWNQLTSRFSNSNDTALSCSRFPWKGKKKGKKLDVRKVFWQKWNQRTLPSKFMCNLINNFTGCSWS